MHSIIRAERKFIQNAVLTNFAPYFDGLMVSMDTQYQDRQDKTAPLWQALQWSKGTAQRMS